MHVYVTFKVVPVMSGPSLGLRIWSPVTQLQPRAVRSLDKAYERRWYDVPRTRWVVSASFVH